MINQELIQPNIQNAPQDKNWEKIYNKYYDNGNDLLTAQRKLKSRHSANQYQLDALAAFYESKKKTQEDQSQSDVSLEVDSGVSTSTTSQETQVESGDSDSTIQPTKLDTIVGKKPTPIPTYQLASAPVVFDTDEEYKKKFGEGSVFKLNPNRLLTEQKDSQIFADLQLIEQEGFDRWYNRLVGNDPRLQAGIEQFLSDPDNVILKEYFELGMPLHFVKDGVMDMLGVLDVKPGEFDLSEGMPQAGAVSRHLKASLKEEDMTPAEKYAGQKIGRKTAKRLDKSWNDFFRDMVLDSLPQDVRLNENKLKDLEYYFKMGSDNLFDFTGDREIGNKTWWQDGLTAAELGGMTFINKIGYLGSRISGWMSEAFVGEGSGDSLRSGFDKGVKTREKEMADMRAKMNSFEESISSSFSDFMTTADLTSLNNYFEQSFLMTMEASPQIAGAIAGASAGLGPTGLALMLTADGVATEAYMISNDISFDDFIDKETGEKLNYYEALENIPVSEGDTMEDLQEKLKVMYDIETNYSNRGWYLGSIAATDFIADRVTFGIAARAMRKTKFDPLNQNNRQIIKNLLIGTGVALPESSIPTLISAMNRELQKAGRTGDPNFDAYEAFNRALDITLGVAPLGPTMHILGSARAYTKHLSNGLFDKNGMNANQRKLLEDLQETANNPQVTSKERMEAMQMINQVKKEGRAFARRLESFYNYVGQRSRVDLDEITNIDLRLQKYVRQYDSTKNPKLKIVIKNKMADLIKMRNDLEGKYVEGFDNSYEVNLKDPVSGREYTVRFDEEGGIISPDEVAAKKSIEEKAAAKKEKKDAFDARVKALAKEKKISKAAAEIEIKKEIAKEKKKAEGEPPPIITPDDANKKTPDKTEKPLEGEPRNKDDDSGVEAEEAEVQSFKGGWLRKLYRETFRTDAGTGGSRGLKFWEKRPYEPVAETVLQQQRTASSLRQHVAMDLGMLDALVKDLNFGLDGKRLSGDEYGRRQGELNKYLKGDENARVSFLNDAQKAKIDYLRGRIDATTGDIIRLLEENPTPQNKKLVEKLKSNQGQYLKRSYEAFSDDGAWMTDLTKRFDKMPADKKILFNDAVDFIMSEEGFTGTRKDASKLVSEYLREIKDKMDSGDFGFGTGTIGALDTKMFTARKDIPEPFRKLLGEIDNINFNYVNTMHRMTGYVADLKYQKSLKSMMLDFGLGTETFAQGLVPLTKGNAYSGLDGMYVDPVFKQMYESMMPLPASPSKFWRTIHGLQGMVKIGKTQYSPTTTARNLISGTFLGFNSGHFFLSNPNQMQAAKTMAWGDLNVINANARLKAESLNLIEKGVLGDGARAREAMNMLRDWSNATEANRIAQQKGGGLARRAARKLQDVTSKMYAFGDDFYKVTGYYIETNKLLRESPNMTRAEAENIAAARVRNGYPTYSMIPRNIKKLRRFPLSGMFVSFPYEVYRTTGNNLRYIAEDISEGRPRMAMERIMGMTVANGLGFGLFSYTKDIFDYTDEDVDAIRMLGSRWSANARPAFMPMEEGDMNYIDLRSFLPQEQIWAPVMTLLGEGNPGDETLVERVNSAIAQVLEPFTAMDATSKFAFEIFNNRKEGTGQPIYYYDQDKNLVENVLDNDTEIANYLMRSVGPGAYSNLAEFLRANEIMPEVFGTKETPYKEFTNADAILALMGFRVQTLSLKAGTIQAIHEETMDLNAYMNFHLSKSDISLWENRDPEYLAKIGYEYADKQAAVAQRASKMVTYAIKSQMTEAEFAETLFQSGVSKTDAGILYVNGTKGTDIPLSPKLINKNKLLKLYDYARDSHKGTPEELNEKFANIVEAVMTFNLNTIEKWKTYFPNYELKNDKENKSVYKQSQQN